MFKKAVLAYFSTNRTSVVVKPARFGDATHIGKHQWGECLFRRKYALALPVLDYTYLLRATDFLRQ